MPKTVSFKKLKKKVSKAEWQARCDLAAAYRLVALNGWDDLIYTHISMRIPDEPEHFLINPLGLLFEEITASSLIKIDKNGEQLTDSPYGINKAGFIIHSAVHEARPDVACVLHLHTDYGVALSNLQGGLMPLFQNALFTHNRLAYHDYEGIAVREGEKERLVKDLGSKSAMILRNHGSLTVGASVAEAFELMFFLERAAKIQMISLAACSTSQKLHKPSPAAIENAQADIERITGQNGSQTLVWPALLRKLDRIDPSYKR